MFDKNRLEALREKYPKQALELDLVSGRVNPETGEVNPDHISESMQDLMELNVLEVYELIDNQGHSGFSHGYMVSLLIPLLKDLPITHLTGRDWEWRHLDWFGKNEYQNSRCAQVFKKDGEVYNSRGYAFSDDGGKCFYTSKDSHKPITFPCKSKDLETEYVILMPAENKIFGCVTSGLDEVAGIEAKYENGNTAKCWLRSPTMKNDQYSD